MIFSRAAFDVLTFCGSIYPAIRPGVNAYASDSVPSVEVAPLKSWFFTEGQTRSVIEANNRSGIWGIEIQILLRGEQQKRKAAEDEVNALSELLYASQAFTSTAGVIYSCFRPSTFSPRPVNLGTDETNAELVSLSVEVWQIF